MSWLGGQVLAVQFQASRALRESIWRLERCAKYSVGIIDVYM